MCTGPRMVNLLTRTLPQGLNQTRCLDGAYAFMVSGIPRFSETVLRSNLYLLTTLVYTKENVADFYKNGLPVYILISTAVTVNKLMF